MGREGEMLTAAGYVRTHQLIDWLIHSFWHLLYARLWGYKTQDLSLFPKVSHVWVKKETLERQHNRPICSRVLTALLERPPGAEFNRRIVVR